MFNQLSKKFSSTIKKLRNQVVLNEKNISDAISDLRLALLEADVNIEVVDAFIESTKSKLIGTEISKGLNASQEVIKIIKNELLTILKQDENHKLKINKAPSFILMAGLQGSGKTTTCAKLAAKIKKDFANKKVLLVACDIYRPAAIDQLKTLGKQIDVPVFEKGTTVSPIEIAKEAYHKGQYEGFDVVILDTAGRLHIDKDLMKELKEIKSIVKPAETIMVVDALSGQDLINVVSEFNKEVKLTSIIISKMDGDAKGGAALSISYLLHLPIKFSGIGEKISQLEEFVPERMVERILGMGDMLTFIEKVKESSNEEEMEKSFKKMMNGKFDLEDLYKQMKIIKRLGKLQGLLRFLPNAQSLNNVDFDKAEEKLRVTEILICSMTREERKNPKLLKAATRKERILKGSGRTIQEYNQLLRQWEQSLEMMKNMKNQPMMSQFQRSGGFKSLLNQNKK